MTQAPVIRTYRPGDDEGWLGLVSAAPDFVHDFFDQHPSAEVLRLIVAHPQMDAAHNLFFAESRGQVVAYAELWRAPAHPRLTSRILVHPQWRRRGLGSALLSHVERRARAEGGRYLDILAVDQSHAACEFLSSHGFSPVHYGWAMALANMATLPAPTWPRGYGMRTFVPGRDELTTVEIENASFQDEWEYMPMELGEIQGLVRTPSFQPEGVFFALHQNQVVGESWNWIDSAEREGQTREKRGDVWGLCVHPQHRRRGLGRALLLAGLHWLRGQGVTRAHLTVDGDNELARRLYESVGFAVQRTDVWYRKQLSEAHTRSVERVLGPNSLP